MHFSIFAKCRNEIDWKDCFASCTRPGILPTGTLPRLTGKPFNPPEQ